MARGTPIVTQSKVLLTVTGVMFIIISAAYRVMIQVSHSGFSLLDTSNFVIVQKCNPIFFFLSTSKLVPHTINFD